MKKRVPLLVMSLISIAVILGSTVAAAEQITLRWFMRWDKVRLDNVAKPIIEEFQKKHPNIKIEIENIASGREYTTKLLTMAAGGAMPDVLYPNTCDANVLAAKGALLDLRPFMKLVDLTAYDRRILDLYRYKGGIYGLPIDRAALAIFYNKDMFDEAKVPYPTKEMTWDEFIALAKKLTKDKNGDGRIDQWGVHLETDTYWQVFLYHMTGKNMYDDLYKPTKFLMKEPKAVEAIQLYADMMLKHKIAPTPSQRAGISDLFVAGSAAMNIIGHWRVPQYIENCKFRWDVAPLPHGPYKANRADGSCFAIGKNTKHPKEAWEFVKYLAGPDSPGVKKLLELQQMVPAITKYQKSDLFLKSEPQINKKAFLAYSDRLVICYQPLNTDFQELDNIIRTELNKVWEGEETAAEAIKNITPKVEAVLMRSNI
ncbi:MAG: sugar ABC transporter substrate-binding protein [Firmicutes bacterium]|nr:sugar ABC transporter substrate-binding protein [Bacillota bacterium]